MQPARHGPTAACAAVRHRPACSYHPASDTPQLFTSVDNGFTYLRPAPVQAYWAVPSSFAEYTAANSTEEYGWNAAGVVSPSTASTRRRWAAPRARRSCSAGAAWAPPPRAERAHDCLSPAPFRVTQVVSATETIYS